MTRDDTGGDLVLRQALADVGISEATGRNDGAPAALYMRGDRLPWCAAAVWTWHVRAGYRPPGGYWRMRNVGEFERACQEDGSWLAPGSHEPLAGDVVFYMWRLDSDDGTGTGRHMGVVDHVAHGYLHTVEGNVRDAVRRCRRRLDDEAITGYARLWS